MSEYQYYEFRAIDRSLSKAEIAELRAISTRATITPTLLQNEYQWGDFKGDPVELMERYFDAFFYTANWGTTRLMLRLPASVLDADQVKPYCVEGVLDVISRGPYAIIELLVEDESGELWIDEDSEDTLSSLIPLRADLAAGDLRCLYLGWLAAAQLEMLEEENEVEPPVPPGLGELTPALHALAEVLRLDEELIAAAAERSAPLSTVQSSTADIADWIHGLTGAERETWLLRFIEGKEPHLRGEVLRRIVDASGRASEPASGNGRTAAELQEAAAERTRARNQREAKERAAKRAAYLDDLARRQEALWREIEELVGAKQAGPYDTAVSHLKDLHELAQRDEAAEEFQRRLNDLRQRHAKKPAFITRLEKARLLAA